MFPEKRKFMPNEDVIADTNLEDLPKVLHLWTAWKSLKGYRARKRVYGDNRKRIEQKLLFCRLLLILPRTNFCDRGFSCLFPGKRTNHPVVIPMLRFYQRTVQLWGKWESWVKEKWSESLFTPENKDWMTARRWWLLVSGRLGWKTRGWRVKSVTVLLLLLLLPLVPVGDCYRFQQPPTSLSTAAAAPGGWLVGRGDGGGVGGILLCFAQAVAVRAVWRHEF